MSSMPSLASILRRLMELMECLLLFIKNVLSCWHPAWSNSFVSAYQHLPFLHAGSIYAFIQPVPKKGDRSNPSSYRPIDLLSCLSKAFESVLNRMMQKPLSTSDFLSDCYYWFRKGRSTGDLLAFLTNTWSSSLKLRAQRTLVFSCETPAPICCDSRLFQARVGEHNGRL